MLTKYVGSIGFVLTVCFLFGCANENLSDIPIPVSTSAEGLAVDTSGVQTIQVAKTGSGISPAAEESSFEIPDINTDPKVVCRQFIESLNEGNREHFELLLSPTSLAVSSKLKFSLPPLGEPNAEIHIDEPAFSTIRQKLCFVQCRVVDSETTEFRLMLRKGKNGFRVAGMTVNNEDGTTKNLLSFENYQDVAEIRDTLSETPED